MTAPQLLSSYTVVALCLALAAPAAAKSPASEPAPPAKDSGESDPSTEPDDAPPSGDDQDDQDDQPLAEFGFSVGPDISLVNVAGAEDLNNLNTRIGVRFDRFVPIVTFDFARVSAETTFDSPDFEAREFDFTLLTVGGGLKYLFASPEEGDVVPFVVGQMFTAIPLIRDAEDELGPAAGIDNATSIGYLVGAGAQYQVTRGFSIGAELGSDGLFATLDQQAKQTSVSIIQFYTAAHLSFFF